MSRTKLGRREFIASAAKTFGALGISSLVAESLMGHLLGKAYASGNAEAFYIHLSMSGGPPRWYFDQALNPSGSAADFIGTGFGNFIDKGANGIASAVHSSHLYKVGSESYHLPPIWGMSRSGFNNEDLLRHMQMFRGMDMQINNHNLSNQRQVAPVIGGASIGGSLADASRFAIAGVSAGGSPAAAVFRSEKGLAAVGASIANGANPINALMRPFRPVQQSAITDPQWEKAIGASMEEFEVYLKSIGTRPNVMREAYDQAIELIKSDKYGIGQKWEPTYQKYKSAVDEAFSADRIRQLFKDPVKADGTLPFRRDVTGAGANVNLTHADLREMFTARSTSANMADSFALAELLVTEKISSNVTLQMAPPTGYALGTTAFNVTHDQHRIGAVLSILSTTAFYRCMINCLQELVTELKRAQLFDATVIHVGSEFSRTPQSTGGGSDHGYAGSSTSIISGKIQQFGLIGNIHKAGGSTTYPGTWGRAAAFSNGRGIWVQDVANTICAMLAIKPVSENGALLLDASNGWKPIRKEAKNVA